jgi:pimeloyl-ACP methyl ester carboxylesterase/DNA-binding CsgD family transcriptional regulator
VGVTVEQRIRLHSTDDGVRVAWAMSGSGPPLVKAPNYLTHLEHDWDSPVWSHWLRALSSFRTLVRYDPRGCGMSDLDVDDFTLDTWVEDLEAVVDAAGLDTFPLLGISAGAPIAISYAARHPDRVTKLVLYGGYARGRHHRDGPDAQREADVLLDLTATGWGQDNPAFRRVFTTLFMPGGSPEQVDWFDELQRLTVPPENAVRFEQGFFDIDVRAEAQQVRAPALVLHARGDAMCPVEGGYELAALLPHSEFMPLAGENHILLEHEPAWPRFLAAVREFLDLPVDDDHTDPRAQRLRNLTPRQHEVLDLIARGRSNDEIAAELVVSPTTVRNHITRIFRTLDVRDRAQAIVVARDAGLGR